VLLGVGVLATGGVAALGAAVGKPERVARMWVGATLSEEAAAVTEVIDYDFGVQSRHGIYRTIPGLDVDAPVAVSSPTAPDGIHQRRRDLSGNEPGVRLQIGDPDRTVTGTHRYRIDYEHTGLHDGGRLAWDAVGTAWEVGIGEVEVHVVAPWSFEDLQCSRGRSGDRGGCELTQPEPGHLVAALDDLPSGHGVTIYAQRGDDLAAAPALPVPPEDAPEDPGTGVGPPALAAGAAALGAAAVTSRLVRRAGRERVGTGGVADAAWSEGDGSTSEVLLDHAELAAMATTEFAPPEGLTPAMGGVILTESVRPEHKVAWLIEMAIDGAIVLDESGDDVRLVRSGEGRPDSKELLDRMFGGRREVELGEYDPTFAAAWKDLGTVLASWKAQSGLWDPAGNRRMVAARALGALAAVIGVIATGFAAAMAARHGAGWLPLVVPAAAVTAAGVAALVRSWELKVRTPRGSGLWLRVESFRRFLAGSEAHHAEEAAKRGVLREYTAWAVALGEIDRWQRAVDASTVTDTAALGYVHVAPALMASTARAATAPSSSGGGGGGSVGGGGGGGGGGSW